MTVVIQIARSQIAGTKPANPAPGQVFVDTSVGHLYVANATGWVDITASGPTGGLGTPLIGPRGAPGPAGATTVGPPGPPGPPG